MISFHPLHLAARLAPAVVCLAAIGCAQAASPGATGAGDNATRTTSPATTAPQPASSATAIFAGGCFWCMEKPFDELPGVISTTSGYTGGTVANPTYQLVGAGGTGHAEAVEVRYDPARISYAQLLAVYWRQVDPFDGDGQFCDQGDTYRPAIFVANAQERAAAEAEKAALETRFARPILVKIEPASTFWPAEAYHQDYYQKNPARYRFYRSGCGRDARLRAVWGAEAKAD